MTSRRSSSGSARVHLSTFATLPPWQSGTSCGTAADDWLISPELYVEGPSTAVLFDYYERFGDTNAQPLAVLVTDAWTGDPTTTTIIFLLCGVIQFVNGNVIDPMMMGRALRLSSFGIIISLAFWSAVWGIPGMFLSVPIMVMLLVVCSHIPALRPVAILLSREGLPDSETLTRKK